MALALLSVLAVGAPVAQATHRDDTMADAECELTPGGVAGSAALAGENGVNHVGSALDVTGDWGNGFSYDLTAGVQSMLMDTDPGHFNFSGTAICKGRDVAAEGPAPAGPPNAPAPQIIPPGTYTITASGDFDNLICGTGTANGDAVIVGPVGTSPPTVQIFTEFAIKFNGGVGAGGLLPPYKGKLVFVVDADPTSTTATGGQIPTAPDGAESWAGSAMAGLYGLNGGHSYAVVNNPDGTPNGNQIDGGGGTGDVTITPSVGNCVNQDVTQFLVNGEFEGFLSGEGSTVSDGSAVSNDSDG
jgi:hypothetical protein